MTLLAEEDKRQEEKEKEKEKDLINKKPAQAKNTKDPKASTLEVELHQKDISLNKTRWVKESGKERLLVRFLLNELGEKVQPVGFEIMAYPPVQTKLVLNGIAD